MSKVDDHMGCSMQEIRWSHKGRVSEAHGRVRIMSDGGASSPGTDQIQAHGAGIGGARGALCASGISLMAGQAAPVRDHQIQAHGAGIGTHVARYITSDGGAKQPRYGIRFKRRGQASGAHVARYVHLGSCLMAGPSSPVRDQIQAHGAGIGGARGALCASGIMYDGGPGMQSHHTHRNFLFGMVHLPPSGGTRWVTI
ncbi:hypothetical protein B0H17DRAFT_1144406 [Mycena rosella]|uniref:Uncharacterized protein n=1 Tax=Mycena rosella TaxID=1033263 RepID=A0AAD7CTJ1_MYCRO|nr:hypothetical protein B0H17DRAFT_1144406 [Mycena rosella]